MIVTATSVDTGLSRSVETDTSGNYFFSELPLGEYTVSASLPGFAPQTVKGVEVEASRSRVSICSCGREACRKPSRWSPAARSSDSTRNVQGGTIEGEQAAEIPLNGRDFVKLLTLVPGTAADPSGINDSPGSFGLFSINGNRGRSNNYLLDGTDMNDGYRNLPAINEARRLRHARHDPAGRRGRGVPRPLRRRGRVRPQRGRDRQHRHQVRAPTCSRGSASSTSATTRSARGTSSTRSRAPKNDFRNNQFGGSLGGAFKKDKTFYFVAYEGQRENGGLPGPARVPDADARSTRRSPPTAAS